MRRIVTTAVAGLAAIAASLTMAGVASANPGITQISPEHSGYSATSAQFKDVSASVYLRNPEQYTGVVAGFGHSVQLWSADKVIVLGVSDTTAAGSKASGFSPAVAVFNRSDHSLTASSTDGTISATWHPAGGPPQPATAGGSFPVGTTVTERAHYNLTTGDVNFTATDTAGDQFTATYAAGLGQSFNQARIGTEFGSTPWTAPATFTPPANWAKIGVFNNARLVTYSGHAGTLTSWWVTHVLEANTVAQSATGDWVSVPSNFGNGGASFATFFVPASGQQATHSGSLAVHAAN